MYLMPRENLNVPSDDKFELPKGIGSKDAIKARQIAYKRNMGAVEEEEEESMDIEGYILKYSPSLLRGW